MFGSKLNYYSQILKFLGKQLKYSSDLNILVDHTQVEAIFSLWHFTLTKRPKEYHKTSELLNIDNQKYIHILKN